MHRENIHIVIVLETEGDRQRSGFFCSPGPPAFCPEAGRTEAWHTRHASRALTLGSSDEGEVCSREANDLCFGRPLLPQGEL